MYQIIKENRGQYPVEKMCRHFQISKNAFYSWCRRTSGQKELSNNTDLKTAIRRIFEQSNQCYRSYRIQKQLEREGLKYSRSYVSLLMKRMGLRSVVKRKFKITTQSDHSYRVTENILNREFDAKELGQKWVSDITYVRVNDNWNYLTTIIDLADRKVVGWSLSEDMTTQNTFYRAWIEARKTREISDNLIFHSDRGVQYASTTTSQLLATNKKITQSMSRKGNCWDNAVAESFFKTIKWECLNRQSYQSYMQLYQVVKEYIHWYNTKRLHSSLGYMTPLEKEIQLRCLTKRAA